MYRNKDAAIGEFEETLRKSVNDLDISLQNLQSSIQLEPCQVNLSAYQTPEDYANAAHHPEVITALEGVLILLFEI